MRLLLLMCQSRGQRERRHRRGRCGDAAVAPGAVVDEDREVPAHCDLDGHEGSGLHLETSSARKEQMKQHTIIVSLRQQERACCG